MAASHNVTIEIDSSGCGISWVTETEKMIEATSQSAEMARWSKRSIYRVPAWIKNLHPGSDDAYRPRLVSLGPFHHGASGDLFPMEEHKRRAMAHLVRRSGRPLQKFVAAVRVVADQLRDAYEDLGEEWSGERFVELMLTDGCFLLEVLRIGIDGSLLPDNDYSPIDPFFSDHVFLYSADSLRHDVLLVENQLPLLLLHTLVTVQRGSSPNAKEMNYLVLDAMWYGHPDVDTLNHDLALHVLDIYHKSLRGDARDDGRGDAPPVCYVMPSAEELYEAGISIKAAGDANLQGIRFDRGELRVPVIWYYDDSGCELLNLLSFERLRPGAGSYVMEYVVFMDNLVVTAADVALLRSGGVIVNLLGSDEELATLFNNVLSKGAAIRPSSRLHDVHRQVSDYCRQPWNKWRATLIHTYFSNPWVFISLVAAIILLIATLMQTVYTVLPFYRNKQ